MGKNLMLFISLILFAVSQCLGQDDQERDVKEMKVRERIFVGGFLGLQFGTQTAINVSPLVGYRFTNRISAGVGGTYQYYNDRFFGRSQTSHVFGYSFFTRFRVIPRAFLHAEYEMLNLISRPNTAQFEPGTRIWEANYFLGGGYRLPLSEKVSFNLLVLYNFNPNSQAYYQNPIFRFGVDVSL